MTYVPDARFPTNNDHDIPLLDMRMCADYAELPVIGWGTTRRTDKMTGTWHFYVDDYRFENLWKRPDRIVDTGCKSIIEPNFSVFQQTPRAYAAWQIYRKRWLSRYWQSRGITVFADLNVSREWQHLNILGIPDGWYSFATRGYTDRWKDTLREWQMAGEIAGDNVGKMTFLVYGGGKTIRKMCGDYGFVWIPEQEDAHKDIPYD